MNGLFAAWLGPWATTSLAPVSWWAVAAFLSSLAVFFWFWVRQPQTLVWVPALQVLKQGVQRFPEWVFRRPRGLSFWVFLALALLAAFTTLKPAWIVQKQPSTKLHRIAVFVDMSASVSAYLSMEELIDRVEQVVDAYQGLGQVDVVLSGDMQRLWSSSAASGSAGTGAGSGASLGAGAPRGGQALPLTSLPESMRKLGFHRHALLLGEVFSGAQQEALTSPSTQGLEGQRQKALHAEPITSALQQAQTLVLMSDGDGHSWGDFAWSYWKDHKQLFWFNTRLVDSSDPVGSASGISQKVEQLNLQAQAEMNLFVEDVRSLKTLASPVERWRVRLRRVLKGQPEWASFALGPGLSGAGGGASDAGGAMGTASTAGASLLSRETRAKLRVFQGQTLRAETGIVWPAGKSDVEVEVDWVLDGNELGLEEGQPEQALSAAQPLRWLLSLEPQSGADPQARQTDALTLDNELVTLPSFERPRALIVGGVHSERYLEDPSFAARASLEAAGFAVQRLDDLRQRAHPASFILAYAGLEEPSEAFCPAKKLSRLTRSVWLSPGTAVEDFRALCGCASRLLAGASSLAGARAKLRSCQQVRSRLDFSDWLASAGAEQVGGEKGAIEQALAWQFVLPKWADSKARPETSGLRAETARMSMRKSLDAPPKLLIFTVPLRVAEMAEGNQSSGSSGLTLDHGSLPLLVHRLLAVQEILPESWRAERRSEFEDRLGSAARVPLGESLLRVKRLDQMPPAWSPGLNAEQRLRQETLTTRNEKPWARALLLALLLLSLSDLLLSWYPRRRSAHSPESKEVKV